LPGAGKTFWRRPNALPEGERSAALRRSAILLPLQLSPADKSLSPGEKQGFRKPPTFNSTR
jgi:hypothetical protein